MWVYSSPRPRRCGRELRRAGEPTIRDAHCPTIREAVIADAALATNANHLTIIAASEIGRRGIVTHGIVTLRGPVRSGEEKANIGAKARQVAGVTSVSNQIEIASD